MTEKELDLLDDLIRKGFNLEFNRCCDDWDEELLHQIDFTPEEIDNLSREFGLFNGDPQEYTPDRFLKIGMTSAGIFLYYKLRGWKPKIENQKCEICGKPGTSFCDDHFGEGWQ